MNDAQIPFSGFPESDDGETLPTIGNEARERAEAQAAEDAKLMERLRARRDLVVPTNRAMRRSRPAPNPARRQPRSTEKDRRRTLRLSKQLAGIRE